MENIQEFMQRLETSYETLDINDKTNILPLIKKFANSSAKKGNYRPIQVAIITRQIDYTTNKIAKQMISTLKIRSITYIDSQLICMMSFCSVFSITWSCRCDSSRVAWKMGNADISKSVQLLDEGIYYIDLVQRYFAILPKMELKYQSISFEDFCDFIGTVTHHFAKNTRTILDDFIYLH